MPREVGHVPPGRGGPPPRGPSVGVAQVVEQHDAHARTAAGRARLAAFTRAAARRARATAFTRAAAGRARAAAFARAAETTSPGTIAAATAPSRHRPLMGPPR